MNRLQTLLAVAVAAMLAMPCAIAADRDDAFEPVVLTGVDPWIVVSRFVRRATKRRSFPLRNVARSKSATPLESSTKPAMPLPTRGGLSGPPFTRVI